VRAPGLSSRAALLGAILAIASAASAGAFQALPSGGQVNDDLPAGINSALSVSGEDPANADVVGGALEAGLPAVPWAVFRQQQTGGAHDQVYARSFAAGAWATRGSGTVGGRSSASPIFEGSLNFDQAQDAEAPSLDFAGAGRTVPWATWYEDTTGSGFGTNNIFVSRFDNSGDANQGKWIFAGQDRGLGGGSVPVASLNIHTDQDAENPSVAGGSTANPTKPGPWVTWQETTPGSGKRQIFVVRSIGPGAENCDGLTPQGTVVGGHVPAVGGFCWQQVGLPRVGPGGADPSLNVDPTRDAIEPDIAFSGSQDGVPWVVWSEQGVTGVAGLHDNGMVFAAKGVSDASANGGFHWTVVGSALSATLDTTGTYGACAQAALNEEQCSLNKSPGVDAEEPRVAAGTMDAAKSTVPWVVWDEDVAGVKQVFVSRLVGTGAGAHFELANDGAPISTGADESSRPDITFSGHTPYVSWREDVGGGVVKDFHGHFVNPANPTFVLDESDVPLSSLAQADVREPISSSCIATPFNADGSVCQGGAVGTPFFLFTSGTSPLGLFADAYQPTAPVTGGASSIDSSSATVSGTINPEGATVNVSFQYGTTTAYGQSTAVQPSGASNAATPFTAALTGLPAAATIHYRAVAVSDFGTFVGGDQTLATAAASTSPSGSSSTSVAQTTVSTPKATVSLSAARVSGSTAGARVACSAPAGATCRVAATLTVTETLKAHKLVAVTARSKPRKTRRVVVVGAAEVSLRSGQAQIVQIKLNSIGKHLLASRHRLKATLRITQPGTTGGVAGVSTQIVTFKAPKRRRGRRG
jgi:hypothetical protein